MHADFWLEILKRGCHGEVGPNRRSYYQALANTVMNVRVPEKDGNILTS
jgi:hypothetical protein